MHRTGGRRAALIAGLAACALVLSGCIPWPSFDSGQKTVCWFFGCVENPRYRPLLPPTVPPAAAFTMTPNPTGTGATVTFDASGSSGGSAGGIPVTITTYAWDFEGNGVFRNSMYGAVGYHSYEAAGTYDVTLRVTDSRSRTDTETHRLVVEESVEAAAAAAAARRRTPRFALSFTKGRAVAPKTTRRGSVTIQNALKLRGAGKGTMRGGKGPAYRAARQLIRGQWRAWLSSRLNARTGKGAVQGTAFVRTRGGRNKACFALSMPIRKLKAGTGTMTLIGGTGAAGNIRMKARARLRGIESQVAERIQLVGTIKVSRKSVPGIPAGCGAHATKRTHPHRR